MTSGSFAIIAQPSPAPREERDPPPRAPRPFRLLGMPAAERPGHYAPLYEATPNCWLAPNFDPIQMVRDLALCINGKGGHIEQSYLYLDPMSAACWCAITEHAEYRAGYGGAPFDRAAAQVVRSLRAGPTAGLDVLALGCGDGRNEIHLIQHLLRPDVDVRLFLLDISQPLLSVAYRHAAETLDGLPGVRVCGVQGNFHDLPRYWHMLGGGRRRRRLACLLGYTFGNLQNEIHFLRDSLIGFAAGDLLLLQVGVITAPPDRPDEILRREPRLGGRMRPDLSRRWDDFLCGPFRRYGRDVTEVELSAHLDTACCPIAHSYAIEIRAGVRHKSGERKRFALAYSKRYELIALSQALRQVGWDPVDGWRYGSDASQHALYLFRKRQDDVSA